MTVAERFWPKVDQSGDCWTWAGWHGRDGYGRVWYGRSMGYAHRVAYLLAVGPIPEGTELDHLCRNRGCVNPAHLEPVSHAENLRRSPVVMRLADRCRRGHLMTPANTYRKPNGRRNCRTCRYAAVKRSRAVGRDADDEIQPVDPYLEGKR